MNVLNYFRERFGIEESSFDDYGLYMGSKGRVFLGPKTLIDKPPIVAPGILIARISETIKPTSNFIQMFAHLAKRNVAAVSKEQAKDFVRGGDLECDEGSDGYVIVRYGDWPLGCGLLKGKTIKNLLPKSKRQELKYL
jgi:NOL1/NOP2/fmu family ribosome biogenesis protein